MIKKTCIKCKTYRSVDEDGECKWCRDKDKGPFDGLAFGKVLLVESGGEFYASYIECTLYKFKLELETKQGIVKGEFYHRILKTVDDLDFKAGEYVMCEHDDNKNKLKPIR